MERVTYLVMKRDIHRFMERDIHRVMIVFRDVCRVSIRALLHSYCLLTAIVIYDLVLKDFYVNRY